MIDQMVIREMKTPLKDLPIMWSREILGEMIWFESPDEIKKFVSMIGVTMEKLYDCGIYVRDPDCSGEIDCYSAPVFESSNNSHLKTSQLQLSIEDDRFFVHPDNLELDERIYQGFPMIAYVYVEDSWDRSGAVDVFIFHPQSTTSIQTISEIDKRISDNLTAWSGNTTDALENERTRDRHYSRKYAERLQGK